MSGSYAVPSNVAPLGGGNGSAVAGSGINMPGYVPIGGPAVTQLTQLGLNQGLSPWALLAEQQQEQLKENAQSQGAQSVAGQTAQTDAGLEANGGLSSGARERAAEGGAKNYISMVQSTGQQANANDMQIGMNDEQNKIQQLGTAANIEGQNATAANSYNQNAYNTQMQAWAANQQANATENAGKGGK